jgi:transposase
VDAKLNETTTKKWLSDSQWEILKPILFRIRNYQGPSKRQDDREFLNAVAYLIATNSKWRDLPTELGNWHSVYMRFRRWEDTRIWASIRIEIDDRNARKFADLLHCEDNREKCNIWRNYKNVRERLISSIEMEVW